MGSTAPSHVITSGMTVTCGGYCLTAASRLRSSAAANCASEWPRHVALRAQIEIAKSGRKSMQQREPTRFHLKDVTGPPAMSRRESTLICILPTVLLLAIRASAFILAVRTYDDMARTSKVSAHVHSINVVQPIILAIQSERAYTHLNWATQGAHRGDVAACRVLTDGILPSVDTSALRRILAVAADTPSAVRNVSDVAVRLTAVRATADAGGDTFAMFVDIVYALLTPFMTAVFDSLSPDARHLWHVASALLTIEAVGQHRTGGTGAVASFSDPAVKPSLAQLAPFAGANVLKRFVSELLLIPALQDDAAEAAAVGPALAPAHFIESMRATEAAMYGDGGDLHVDSYGRAFEWFVNTTEIVDAFVGQLSEREADAHAHINVQLSFEVGLFAVVVALALVYVPILPVLVVALAYMRATLSAVLQQLRAPPGGSKCCALVFTDIESSSALWSHGGDSMAILLDTHNDVMRALIAEHKGYEVKTVGDAFFVVFNSPVNAVRFATRVDAAMRTIDVPDMNAALLSVYGMAAPALKVRVGVHLGGAAGVADPRWPAQGLPRRPGQRRCAHRSGRARRAGCGERCGGGGVRRQGCAADACRGEGVLPGHPRAARDRGGGGAPVAAVARGQRRGRDG